MRSGSLVALCVANLLAPALALAACTDPAAVATTRTTAEMACPCAAATSHGGYARCVADVARATLPCCAGTCTGGICQ